MADHTGRTTLPGPAYQHLPGLTHLRRHLPGLAHRPRYLPRAQLSRWPKRPLSQLGVERHLATHHPGLPTQARHFRGAREYQPPTPILSCLAIVEQLARTRFQAPVHTVPHFPRLWVPQPPTHRLSGLQIAKHPVQIPATGHHPTETTGEVGGADTTRPKPSAVPRHARQGHPPRLMLGRRHPRRQLRLGGQHQLWWSPSYRVPKRDHGGLPPTLRQRSRRSRHRQLRPGLQTQYQPSHQHQCQLIHHCQRQSSHHRRFQFCRRLRYLLNHRHQYQLSDRQQCRLSPRWQPLMTNRNELMQSHRRPHPAVCRGQILLRNRSPFLKGHHHRLLPSQRRRTLRLAHSPRLCRIFHQPQHLTTTSSIRPEQEAL